MLLSINNSNHGTILDGIGAAEVVDSSGELIRIKGIDITRILNGYGIVSFEHKDDAISIIGRIIYARKIFSKKDCENNRQLKYWNEVGLPFLYIIAELFDAEHHPGAIAVAAMIKNYIRNKVPMTVRYSIEGKTYNRDKMNKNLLLGTIMTGVAITIKPCNHACVSDVVTNIGEVAPAQENEHPALEQARLSKYLSSYEAIYNPLLNVNPVVSVKALVDNLKKALDAGMPSSAPSGRAQGAALQTEGFISPLKKKKQELFLKNQILAAVRDWKKTEPLGEYLSKELPDIHPSFIQKFADLIDKYELVKKEKEIYLEKLIDRIENIEIEELEKHKPGPDFPKLGIEAYKSTPIITKPSEEAIHRKAIINSQGKVLQEKWKSRLKVGQHGYPETSRVIAEEHLPDSPKYLGLTWGTHDSPNIHSFAKDTEDPMTTKIHEDLHATFRKIGQKYGNKTRDEIINKIYDTMPAPVKGAVNFYIKSRSPDSSHIVEEKLTHMLDYLNSKEDRELLRKKLKFDLSNPDHVKQLRDFDKLMKLGYKHLKNMANKIYVKGKK